MEELELVLYTVPLQVVGEFTPKEEMVMYYSDLSGYPGAPAEFEIEDVFLNGISIYDLMGDIALESLGDMAIDFIEERDNL